MGLQREYVFVDFFQSCAKFSAHPVINQSKYAVAQLVAVVPTYQKHTVVQLVAVVPTYQSRHIVAQSVAVVVVVLPPRPGRSLAVGWGWKELRELQTMPIALKEQENMLMNRL